MYFTLDFIFMSAKWTRTKSLIKITPLLQAYSCLLLVQAAYGFLGIGPEDLIAIGLVLIAHSNKNPFHHILIYKSSFKLLKCEVANLVEVIQLT